MEHICRFPKHEALPIGLWPVLQRDASHRDGFKAIKTLNPKSYMLQLPNLDP